MNCWGEFSRLSLSLDVPLGSLITLWWLALFIEALGLSQNNEREGRHQLDILKENL